MIPYRTQRTLKRLLIGLLIFVILAAALLVCWFLWLQRYVVYTDDGAKLDFDRLLQFSEGEAAQPPESTPAVDFVYNDGTNVTEPVSRELAQFSGYYVTLEELKLDLAAVTEMLKALPEGSTVMLEVKNNRGQFGYSSAFGPTADGLDPTQMGELIQSLKAAGHYLIAEVNAFQDYEYFMADTVNWSHNAHGFAKDGGDGSLWYDKQNQCYWLNPTTDGARSYLIQIISELRALGFHEVVLSEFRISDTDMIHFPGDKIATLNETAELLVKTCATETFAVSFVREKVDLTLPQGRTRLYLQGAAASDAASLAAQTGFQDPAIQLVFLVDTNDTRFDAYSVIRPLEMAR